MKSIMKCGVLAMVFLLTLSAVNGMSEVRKGAVSLSPNIGLHVFQNSQDIDDGASYGLGLGYNVTEHLGIEGNFNYVDNRAEEKNNEDVKAYLYRFDALYHFMPEKRLVPYLAAGVGAIRIDGDVDAKGSDPLFNYGAGLKYFLTENFAIRGDVRHIITDDPKYNVLYTVGFSYLFGGERKAASVVPSALVIKAAAPAAPKPKEAAPAAPKPKEAAPAQPKDSDGDGVYDDMDKCPDTPKGVAVDSNGCPKAAPAAKVETVIALEDIHFDFDKATLTNEAKGILKKDIQTMKENSGIKVRIEGYTCAHGQDDYNLRLSERRANAVKEYLVKEGGISADSLTTIAYGETRLAMPETPTPENKNSAEAKANRRVHFVVVTY